MTRKSTSRTKPADTPAPEFKVNPFADLRARLPELQRESRPPAPPLSPTPSGAAKPHKPPLDVEDQALLEAFKDAGSIALRGGAPAVRIEVSPRRGGQVITRVRGLRGMDVLEQMQMTDDVRVRLGLRARFHEGVLEVDGNEARRLASWLQSRGYALDEDREPSPGNTPQGRS